MISRKCLTPAGQSAESWAGSLLKSSADRLNPAVDLFGVAATTRLAGSGRGPVEILIVDHADRPKDDGRRLSNLFRRPATLIISDSKYSHVDGVADFERFDRVGS